MIEWILIGYMFLFIHRPFEVWPVLADLHVERIYMIGALLAVAVCPGKRWLSNWQHLAYLVFAAAVLLCWLSSPWASQGQQVVEDWFKILAFYVLIVLVVHDERALKRLVLAFLVIMAVYMTHSLREYVGGRHTYRMGIARMIGVDETLGDPNSFGASVVYALPFVTPFWVCWPTWRMRSFLAGYVALSFICIGLTGSRSAFIGLLFWATVTLLRSQWRWRLALPAVLIAPLLWAALPISLQNRFETIVNPEAGPAIAQKSAESRVEGLKIGWRLFEKSPITGCGPGAWRPATGRKLESHNLYGQLLGETGSVGAAAFAVILLGFWLNLRGVRRAYRQHPEWGQDFLYHLSKAVGMAVLLLLFEGNFGHNLLRYSWLWYGAFLIIARHCVQYRAVEQTAAEESAGWDEEGSPVPAYAGID
ncbi:MAG TPA: O-antigen ligase family protein [Gemmataceae bacterium]|nr:O-antigen ligase family protein [Gemmataceae bacterium]